MAKRIVFGLLWTAIGISALVFMHTWVFLVFAMFLCFMATYELNRSIGLKNKPIMILSLIVSTSFPIFYEYGFLLEQIDTLNLKTEYLITTYVLILCFLMLHNHENTKFSDVSFVVMSSLFVPFAFTRLMYFRDVAIYFPYKGYTNAHGIFLILFILFSACFTDTFAYFAGSFLGKHKLCPKISPKKTVEGAIGGVLGCILANVILYAVYNNFFFENPSNNYVAIIIVSAILSVVGMCGDLTASLIKRNYGIKDFGNLIPGHGGIMDRFDSIMFVSAAFYAVFNIFEVSI
ncbi:MAG: CDP-archaeol synthase [Clostridia bacterium]|nr:CDP-archaeol synthase [Clostridia bacterium]